MGGTDWTATGAGTAGFNGQYADDGTYNTKTAYKLDASHYLVWVSGSTRWELQDPKCTGTWFGTRERGLGAGVRRMAEIFEQYNVISALRTEMLVRAGDWRLRERVGLSSLFCGQLHFPGYEDLLLCTETSREGT